jgi:glycosyltransferase involved in cell wall biosynthesis
MTTGRPVRILYCENNVDGTIGGSYYSLLYLVKGLDRARYMPTVVFYTDHALVPVFREAGIETLVWRRTAPVTFGNRLALLGTLAAPVVLLQKALNFARGFLLPAVARAWFLKTRRIEVVHLNNSVLYNHDWMLAAQLAGVRCLTHERGINEVYPSAAKYFGRRLDAVVCISEAVRKNMEERGADFGNLRTIYNGLDPEVMRIKTPPADMRRKYSLDDEMPVVVMTGNIKSWKGQDTLVRAIDVVRRAFPSVRCLLVGATSPDDHYYEVILRDLVASLGVERHIIFAGYQKNVADFLTMSDLVVHASVLPEPFGRVVLEAMACRKPVIGSRAGAIPEIVEEGWTGLMFPPGDHEGLAAAISRLLTDREEAKRLGANGYRRLVDEFHVNRNVAATQRIYEALLSVSH